MRRKSALGFVMLTLFVAQTAFAPKLKVAPVTITLRPAEGNLPQVMFNPKEISIDKPVPWTKHKSSQQDEPVLEFSGAEPQTLAVELLFDTYETTQADVSAVPNALLKMTETNPMTKRPPMLTWVWSNKFPTFKGVIESLNVKYTMFLEDGTPVRCTVNLKMKQASKLTTKTEEPNDCPCD